MNKALITAVMGLSMLYAQSVSANVDRFVLADASSAQSAPSKGHKAQHHAKKHHNKHHNKQHHAGKHHVGKHHHVADASQHHHAAGTSSKSGSKARHHHQKQHHHQYKHEKHYRKHHHNRPHRGYHCPEGNCDEEMGMMDQRAYMRSQAVMGSPDAQINDMDVINRDHAARAGRGR